MKYRLVLLIMSILLSCSKETPLTVIATPAGASNKMEGDIIWGGITNTHYISQPYALSTIYAYFYLDTAYKGNPNYQISMTGYESDTIVSFYILNPNLHTPGVFNFQDLDSNHYVSAYFQSGYAWGGSPPLISYKEISYSNKGRLTIDTISETHISGSIDTYCFRENLVTNIPDTNEIHLLFHFSGDLRRQ